MRAAFFNKTNKCGKIQLKLLEFPFMTIYDAIKMTKFLTQKEMIFLRFQKEPFCSISRSLICPVITEPLKTVILRHILPLTSIRNMFGSIVKFEEFEKRQAQCSFESWVLVSGNYFCKIVFSRFYITQSFPPKLFMFRFVG